MTGLLFELGPCNINKTEGGTVFTSHNPHGWTSVSLQKFRSANRYLAWNNNASVIFLDQPVMTGYSFSSNKTAHVKTTPEAARDVYAFLQLFFRRFEEYSTQPFHIAAESYGGGHLGSGISELNA
jgi:cathepsin A (carboxypeptidase C)